MGDQDDSNHIQLRIQFPTGLLLQEHKTFRFEKTDPTKTALTNIQAKIGLSLAGEFGLYIPPDGPNVGGVWMHEERTLASYNLQNHDTIELKCRARSIKVLIEDSKSVISLMVDYSVTVNAAIVQICEQSKIKNPEDFVLQNGNFMLDPFKSLRLQYPPNSTGSLLLKKKPKGAVIGRGKKENYKVDLPSKMFGVSLRVALDNSAINARIPIVVDKCLEWISKRAMDVPNLFLLPGKPTEVDYYQQSFNHGELIDLSESADPYAVATLLKNFFRELSHPLIPADLYFGFLSAYEMSREDLQLQGYITLFKTIPIANSTVLLKLLLFLSALSHKELINHLSPENIGKVFGPLLLRPPEQHVQTTLYNMSSVSSVIAAMVKNVHVFVKPPHVKLRLAVAKETTQGFAKGSLEVAQGDYLFVIQKEDGFFTAHSWGKVGFIPESSVQFIEENLSDSQSSDTSSTPHFPDTEVASFRNVSLLPVRDASKYQNLVKDVDLSEPVERVESYLEMIQSRYHHLVKERCELQDVLRGLQEKLEQERQIRQELQSEVFALKGFQEDNA